MKKKDIKVEMVVGCLGVNSDTKHPSGNALYVKVISLDPPIGQIISHDKGSKWSDALDIGKLTSLHNINYFFMANSVEEFYQKYPTKIPIKEVVVEKEVIKEVEIITKIDAWNDTFIDRMYNWYCKMLNRNHFV